MTTLYRGANIALFAPPKDVWAVLDLNANVVRYPIVDPNPSLPVGELGPEEYKAWVRSHLDYIEREIFPVLCDCRGQLILTIHTPPGGRKLDPPRDPVFRMFTDRTWAKATFKEVWLEIAHRWLGRTEVLAYDLLNEPAGTASAVLTLNRNTVKVIRTIDRIKPLIVSCPFGDPDRARGFKKIDGANIWYTIHFYEPLSITHQGVSPKYPSPRPYPGPNTGKARMVKVLQEFRRFCADNSVHGIIGETSISGYALPDSRTRYLDDIISLAESYGFDWLYHAWREAPAWHLEGEPLELVKSYWNKND